MTSCFNQILQFITRSLELTSDNITLADWLTDVENEFDYLTTNGIVFPKLTIPTGQKKRFR